jgi:hypothetical protein
MENQAQELRGPAFGLAEAGHEQTGEGNQPWPGLPSRDAVGQCAAGGATAGADKPVLLIFRDEWLDFGEFPDLMTQRLGIGSAEQSAATSADAWHARHDLSALFGRDQVAFVFRMAGLTARWTPRLGLGSRWLGMWVSG